MYMYMHVGECRWESQSTYSTGRASPPNSTKSRNSNSSVQIQINPRSRFESVPRNTKKSVFLNLVDFGGAPISVKTVISVFYRSTWRVSQSRVTNFQRKLCLSSCVSRYHASVECVSLCIPLSMCLSPCVSHVSLSIYLRPHLQESQWAVVMWWVIDIWMCHVSHV